MRVEELDDIQKAKVEEAAARLLSSQHNKLRVRYLNDDRTSIALLELHSSLANILSEQGVTLKPPLLVTALILDLFAHRDTRYPDTTTKVLTQPEKFLPEVYPEILGLGYYIEDSRVNWAELSNRAREILMDRTVPYDTPSRLADKTMIKGLRNAALQTTFISSGTQGDFVNAPIIVSDGAVELGNSYLGNPYPLSIMEGFDGTPLTRQALKDHYHSVIFAHQS